MPDTKLPELKPCPFCGEAPKLTKHFKLEGHYSLVHRCKVIGPISFDFGRPEIHAAAWNTRAAVASAMAMPQEVAESFKEVNEAIEDGQRHVHADLLKPLLDWLNGLKG